MPRPTEPNPSPDCAPLRGNERDSEGIRSAPRLPAWARWTTWVLVLMAAAGGDGCPVDMEPPDDDDGIVCDLGAPIGAPTVSFANDILPLFEDSGCLSAGCHGGFFPSSGYSMVDYESAFQAGDESNAFEICPIVPGDPDGSYLVEKLSPNPRTGARMPFLDDPLTEEEIELVRTWIAEGAPNN